MLTCANSGSLKMTIRYVLLVSLIVVTGCSQKSPLIYSPETKLSTSPTPLSVLSDRPTSTPTHSFEVKLQKSPPTPVRVELKGPEPHVFSLEAKNSQSSFSFELIPPGDYQLSVTAKGFEEFSLPIQIPESDSITVALSPLPSYLEQKEKEAKKKAAEAEEKRKAKEIARKEKEAQNTGIWRIRHFVDEFGEDTDEAYMTNSSSFIGTFSNSATENSELLVDLIIRSDNSIKGKHYPRTSIQLYEYGGNNPVKAYGKDTYSVRVKDAEGKVYSLRAANFSDRLIITYDDAPKLHSALMKGGKILFSINENDAPTSYQFSIPSASYYSNAWRILSKGK